MTVFTEEFDQDGAAVLEPDMLSSPVEGFPLLGVSCFSKKLHDAILEKYGGEKIKSFFTEDGGVPIYAVNYMGTRVAFYLSKVGAPAVVMQMEEVFVMGLRKLIVMGSCGALDSTIAFGDLIVPDSGIRDEGTSYHYLPKLEGAVTDSRVLAVITGVLTERGCPYVCGKTWTTDGLFRETKNKLAIRKNQGCIVVDMEYTAMQAMAKFRGMTFGQILYTEDNLDGEFWEERGYVPRHEEKSNALLELPFECVVRI